MKRMLLGVGVGVALAGTWGAYTVMAQGTVTRGFFITSVGMGNGANLGGLAGADAYCQKLAAAANLQRPANYRAYLSSASTPTQPGTNARDRIGGRNGGWQNVNGVTIATSVENLHSEQNNLNKQTALNERGEIVNGRGDNPNRHDMITGSLPDGTAFPASAGDQTCSNYTSGSTGTVRLGHHDRIGGGQAPTSFNSAHPSSGCSQANLVSTGGAGLFYCFEADGN